MVKTNLLVISCCFIYTCFGFAQQNETVDKIYDVINSANRAYLDEQDYINYLKPVAILRDNISFIDEVGDFAAKHQFIDYLNTANSFIHNKKLQVNTHKEAIITSEFSFSEPKSFIRNQVSNKRLVMLNEAHDTPAHRLFAESLLGVLYEQGFRYLAVETLGWSDKELNERGYVISRSGYYTREPYFANFIRSAIEKGFTVISYEQKQGSGDINERETNQANNLIDVLLENPSSKIFVYAGYAHIQESSLNEDIQWMAERIKDSLSMDPLTIDQTIFIDDFSENKSQLLDLNNESLKQNDLKNYVGVFDTTILNPKDFDELHLDLGKEKYTITFNNDSLISGEPVLLQAYVASEYNALGDKVIPFDQRMILDIQDDASLYLKPNMSYLLIVRNFKNVIIFKKKIITNNKLVQI